jgi:hypothetical protein
MRAYSRSISISPSSSPCHCACSASALTPFWGLARATDRGVVFADHILDPWGRDSRTLLGERLPVLAPGVTETFAHPADDGPELRGYDPDHPDVRVADGLCFTDPQIKALIADTGVIPISYRPLRELQRAQVSRGN